MNAKHLIVLLDMSWANVGLGRASSGQIGPGPWFKFRARVGLGFLIFRVGPGLGPKHLAIFRVGSGLGPKPYLVRVGPSSGRAAARPTPTLL